MPIAKNSRHGGDSENRNARCNSIHADAPRSPETCLSFDAPRETRAIFYGDALP